MDIVVSIVIPCFNHGRYLQEAIESIENNSSGKVEIIIVNDGSTDQTTINKLIELERNGYFILNQSNKGLAAARNNGIKKARGKYILPLDSDNKINKNYLTKAVGILDEDESIDVVYGNRELFGKESGIKKTGPFNFNHLVTVGNYIDACALYRRKVWEKNGGYDGNMPAMGHEDWEFWIHTFLNGGNFYYMDELCFYYRTSSTSMNITTSMPAAKKNKQYIYCKHGSRISDKLYNELQVLQYIRSNRFKSAAKLLLGMKM